MLSWSIAFLVIAILAAILGFGAIVGTAAAIAKFFFWFFVVAFLVSLLFQKRI